MVNPDLLTAIKFLKEIGLIVTLSPGANGFTEYIRIVSGALEVDPFCPPSALLHEAGHLAIIPNRFRGYMNDNLFDGFKKMFSELDDMGIDPDSHLSRACIQSSDTEATAWAWAAGIKLGIPPETIIADNEYAGSGQEIRSMLSINQYLGINGLSHAGMCCRKDYPKMKYWIQSD